MTPKKDETNENKKKEFGTGLRAQLERRRDEPDAKLAEFQAELEERERKVRDQRETIEAEHARIAELQAEVAAEQQLSADRHEQAEKKLRELKSFDRDRSKFSSELEKQRK